MDKGDGQSALLSAGSAFSWSTRHPRAVAFLNIAGFITALMVTDFLMFHGYNGATSLFTAFSSSSSASSPSPLSTLPSSLSPFSLHGSSSSSFSNAVGGGEGIETTRGLSFSASSRWSRKAKVFSHSSSSSSSSSSAIRALLVSASQPHCTGDKRDEGDSTLKLAVKNKLDYAYRHGMDTWFSVELDGEIDDDDDDDDDDDRSDRTAAAKLRVLRSVIAAEQAYYDWFIWMNWDSVVTDMSFRIPWTRYDDYSLVLFRDPRKGNRDSSIEKKKTTKKERGRHDDGDGDFLSSPDIDDIDTSVMIMRNNMHTLSWLDAVIDLWETLTSNSSSSSSRTSDLSDHGGGRLAAALGAAGSVTEGMVEAAKVAARRSRVARVIERGIAKGKSMSDRKVLLLALRSMVEMEEEEEGKRRGGVYIETSYDARRPWGQEVERLDRYEANDYSLEVGDRGSIPFAVSFQDCAICPKGLANKEDLAGCRLQYLRTYTFAHNQVIKPEGLRHANLTSEETVSLRRV